MRRVIEPVLADIQNEYAQAPSDARAWRRGWILAAGYFALLKALALYSVEELWRAPLNLTLDERRSVVRTSVWAALITAATTAALLIPPLINLPLRVPFRFRAVYLLALIPQALPLAMPIGLTLAIVAALGGRPASPASKRTIFAVAVLCAMVSFAVMAWVMPRANQAFRTLVFQDAGNHGAPGKGYAELTLGELRRERVDAIRHGDLHRARGIAIALHTRWSIAFATALMAAFALSLLNRFRSFGRMKLASIACAVFTAYFLIGEYLATRGDLTAFAGVWLPNLLLVLGATVLRLTERFPASQSR
jgi:lipopolysaccharide export LptBFGC system permease protein LptF